jgi:hypothetical protein
VRKDAIASENRISYLSWELAVQEQFAQRLTRLAQRGSARSIPLQVRPHCRFYAVRRDERAVCDCRRRKATRHPNSASFQAADHLAKRRILATNPGNIAHPDVLKRHYEFVHFALLNAQAR